jgi:hypothetical protein
MNRLILLISVAACGVAVHASQQQEWRPSDAFLHAVRAVESSNGRQLVGDNGESLGDFQLSEAAWLDVNEWRKARRLKTYSYQNSVYNGYISRVYASNYLTILHGELSRKMKRSPSHAELYAAYNMGLGTFAECNFRLNRVNPVTRAKCKQIGAMLGTQLASKTLL